MIILDTHSRVWWTLYDRSRLRPAQLDAIQANENDTIGICPASFWEIAFNVNRGTMDVQDDLPRWFDRALRYPGVQVIDLTPAIAMASVKLPNSFPGDPFDRLIAATALIHKCPLVTSDGAIRNHADGVEIIY